MPVIRVRIPEGLTAEAPTKSGANRQRRVRFADPLEEEWPHEVKVPSALLLATNRTGGGYNQQEDGGYGSPMATVRAWWDFVNQSPPLVYPGNWQQCQSLCEAVLLAHFCSVEKSVMALRSYEHSGRAVKERCVGSMEQLLSLGVIPPDLAQLIG